MTASWVGYLRSFLCSIEHFIIKSRKIARPLTWTLKQLDDIFISILLKEYLSSWIRISHKFELKISQHCLKCLSRCKKKKKTRRSLLCASYIFMTISYLPCRWYTMCWSSIFTMIYCSGQITKALRPVIAKTGNGIHNQTKSQLGCLSYFISQVDHQK